MKQARASINIFLLYAEEDYKLKAELETHLSVLSQKGYIDIWHEGKIVFDDDVDVVLSRYIREAQLILLLISANFLAPECYGKYEKDLNDAYLRQSRGEAQVIPVILRPCYWQLDFLAKLQPLPSGGHAVRSRHWDSSDLAFQNIVMGVMNVIEKMEQKNQIPKPPPLPSNAPQSPQQVQEEDEAALALINLLFSIIKKESPQAAIPRVLPLMHKSLVKGQDLEPGFKKYKFLEAFRRIEKYCFPIEVKSKKASGRKSIGSLMDKESGKEWMYTLKKIEDMGGINGQIRIFFPDSGNPPKVSSISL